MIGMAAGGRSVAPGRMLAYALDDALLEVRKNEQPMALTAPKM